MVKKNNEEEEELREEALAEWVSRGRAAQDFTMDKMIKLWEEEDEGKEEEDDEEDLADKQELMKGYQMLGPLVDQAKDAAKQFKETTIEEGKKALITAWKYAELPPLRRRRLLRHHVIHVHEMDVETQKYSKIHQRVVDELSEARQMDEELQFGLKKRNKRHAPLRSRFQELKAVAHRIEQQKALEEIENRRRERIDKMMKEKQRQLEEKQQKAERSLVQRRQRNMKFWQNQLVQAREFAEQQVYERQNKEEFERKVEERKEEMRMVEEEESEDAQRAFDRPQTTSSIGIFDTAFEPGEWNSATDGGYRTGLDEHTIGISTTRGFILENEQTRLELMEIQSKVSMLREKLVQVEQAKTTLGLDMRTILERKDHKLQEIKQVRVEQDELNEVLAGPPRRDPSELEKQHFHTLVTRRAAYMKQLGDLDSRIANIQQRTVIVHRSEASFLPMLREEEEKMAEIQAKLDVIEKDRCVLPVIVGKSIFQADRVVVDNVNGVDGLPIQISKPFIDPTQLLNQVTMESKFEILKSAVKPVNEHYKKAKTQAIESWKVNEFRSLAEQELDSAKARLVKARNRFVDLQTTALRSDIVHAIQKFHQDGNKLRQCIFPLKGQIEWWSHQIPKKSMGLTYSIEHNDIVLADGETNGRITGCFHLPQRCFYRIQMSVDVQRTTQNTKETAEDPEQVPATPEDWKLYIGPEMDSLQHHTFRDIGGKVLRAGDYLTLEFSGIRFCFSLEITHRGVVDPKRKLYRYAINNVARYEERLEDFREEDNRMRLVQNEKHFVSELVKTMRMQSKKSSSQRATELLQELIQVERSKTKMWDSTLFHGHFQRFKRAEYVNMLRAEIKKEVAVQIDYSTAVRQGRVSESEMLATGTPIVIDFSLQGKRKEESRMEFQARKSALMEPKRLAVQRFLGDYCSFKSQTAVNSVSLVGSYRKETMIVGVRYEWREARTKLHVLHKLCGPSSYSQTTIHEKTEWYQLDNANAVFLASSCAKTLRRKRREEAEARVLLVAKDAKIEQLQQETRKNIQEENEAAIWEAKEDETLSQQMQLELARREKLFYADAIRLTTYNENVSSLIDFQVQRKLNVLGQQTTGTSVSVEPIVHDVKENFARQFVQGKLALVKKTWERKTKRVISKRTKARKEREFRIRQEGKLMEEVKESNERELAALKSTQEQRAKEELLRIPNFQAAVEQAFKCEHLELKAWGTKYDFGSKCKKCGKEMSKSCDDPEHAQGGDPELDEDVRNHRAQITSGVAFRFKDANHLRKVENERLRLEKEARSIEEMEGMLYDRLDPKSIDDFNYRHGINRGTLLANADSSDPLYPRLIQDIHRASHQDEILFHGRLRNFNFRIQQIFRQHAECTNRLEVQRVFLENVERENEIVLKKLPLIEDDHARAVALIEEDEAVMKSLEKAKRSLTAAQKEREAAYYAIEGVEEEAEFSEFHAPALIKSSNEMKIIYQRIQAEFNFVTQQIVSSKERLQKADEECSKVDELMSRLYLRTQNSILRTKYGFVKVEYYRVEDECVIATPRHWEATLYIPMDEILAYEAMYKEEESFAMAVEDDRTHNFNRIEQEMEVSERHKMEIEDTQIRTIMAWRAKKEVEEKMLTKVICQDELESQFVYEMEGRKASIESAGNEARQLQRRGRVYPPRRRRPLSQRPSRLDANRVARASEKRLAMATIEQALLAKETLLRQDSKRERDAIAVETLTQEVFGEFLVDIVKELCKEQLQQGKHEAEELLRANGNAIIVTTDRTRACGAVVLPLLGLDRLWVARRQKYKLLAMTWGQEFAKLELVRDEMARREELRRLAEEERLLHEARRKEMLAEERFCRKFYVEETVLFIQERKAMANAEMEMKEYLRQLEVNAMKTKYSKMIDDRNRVNDKAARRLEIKQGKNEQHRLHREWRQIKLEDDLAMQIREQEIAQALAEALERQFDKYLADQLLHGKVTAEMEASRLAARLREAQHVADEKRKAFEAKMVQERMIATVETFYARSRAEVEWMDAIERAKFWEYRASPLEQNLQRMEPELKRIQEEREHVVNDAKSKREYADKCQKRIEEADTSLSRAIEEKEKAVLKYKRVHKLNATIDSEVLHDRVQRFRTSYLRDRLHRQYFSLLTDSIVRRALVECSEREIGRLETQIKQLEQERVFKSKEVSVLQRKRRRTLRMRLRRAELGKLMFGQSQQRLVKEMFQRWTKLWSERTRVRASFKLKHELLLQQQKLTMTTSSPMLKKQRLLRNIKAVTIPTRLSIMHDHQRRVLECRLCRQKYSDEQNNRYSCVYHPGTFEFACVRTCETRRNASSAVPASCMMHRAKRWLCCDETDEVRYGSSGCARRFHLPARNNPDLENLVETKTAKEQTVLDQINQQLLELRERNVVGKMKFATKSIVKKMEQDLDKQRTKAAKFHTLDRRS